MRQLRTLLKEAPKPRNWGKEAEDLDYDAKQFNRSVDEFWSDTFDEFLNDMSKETKLLMNTYPELAPARTKLMSALERAATDIERAFRTFDKAVGELYQDMIDKEHD